MGCSSIGNLVGDMQWVDVARIRLGSAALMIIEELSQRIVKMKNRITLDPHISSKHGPVDWRTNRGLPMPEGLLSSDLHHL